MKYVFLFWAVIIFCSQNCAAQVHDSTEWQRYYGQIERLFEKARKNRIDGYRLAPEYERRYDSLTKEWDKTAILIQNNSKLADSAKVELAAETYWEFFGLCHDSDIRQPFKNTK